MTSARLPTRAATRSFISPAALFVKVIARIAPGCACRAASRYAIRWVSTRVLPEPAPATMSSGAPSCFTAARCCGLSPSSRTAGSLDRRFAGAGSAGPGSWNASSKRVLISSTV